MIHDELLIHSMDAMNSGVSPRFFTGSFGFLVHFWKRADDQTNREHSPILRVQAVGVDPANNIHT